MHIFVCNSLGSNFLLQTLNEKESLLKELYPLPQLSYHLNLTSFIFEDRDNTFSIVSQTVELLFFPLLSLETPFIPHCHIASNFVRFHA